MNLKKSIHKTLVYSDIFDYPLTGDELFTYLVANSKSKTRNQKQTTNNQIIKNVRQIATFKNGFFCLKGRDEIIKKRIAKEKDNEKKITLAKQVALHLAKIPLVQFIGISGAVAMKNAEKDDDIDLFIITKNNSLWLTRLLITIVLDLQQLRRKRGEKKVANKICLNLFVDEHALEFKTHNLYTAHEVAQVMPLINKNQTFEKFIIANKWVLNFMPNVFAELKIENRKSRKTGSAWIVWMVFFFELLAKVMQKSIMQKHQTTEIITDHMLAFHPENYKEKILREYSKRIKKIIV